MNDNLGVYRGMRKDNGKWVEGNFIRKPYGECIYVDNSRTLFTVIYKTVGRYTGTPDKNKKKIFEGDIVKAFKYNEEPFTFEVTYRNGCFWFGNWNWIEFLDIFRSVEVVGNVHEIQTVERREDNA